MASLNTKKLNDEDSHVFLLNWGFINVFNSNPNPCYRDLDGKIIELAADTIIKSNKDLLNIYYKIGISHGIKHAMNKMIENGSEYIKNTLVNL